MPFAAIALNVGGTGAGLSHGALSQCGLLLLLLVLVLPSQGQLVQALLLQQVTSAPRNRTQWRRRGGSGVVYRRLLVLVFWDSRARQTAGAVCIFLASAYVSIRSTRRHACRRAAGAVLLLSVSIRQHKCRRARSAPVFLLSVCKDGSQAYLLWQHSASASVFERLYQ